jgi:hypothetical protein
MRARAAAALPLVLPMVLPRRGVMNSRGGDVAVREAPGSTVTGDVGLVGWTGD